MINDLAYRLARSHPGGITALGARMAPSQEKEKSYGQVLINKLNRNNSLNHLYADEFEQIVDLTNSNLAVAEYFASKANAVVVKLEECSGSDMEILDSFMSIIKEMGELSAEFQQRYADGNISQDDFLRITREARDVHVRLISFISRVEQISDKSLPKRGSLRSVGRG